MQHPIGEHALLADSRTAALIDPDGNVAWLCWPWVDSTPLLFSILDERRGGSFVVRPEQHRARVVSRRYHARSLVLETVWEIAGARLIVEDALDLGDSPLLVRSLRAEGGDVDVRVEFRAPTWEEARASTTLAGDTLESKSGVRVAIRAAAAWTLHADSAECVTRVSPGERIAVTLGAPETNPRLGSIDATLAKWRAMVPATLRSDDSPIRDLLGTTAAVLLGLRNERGGIVAAPTTSLPQWPGSSRTW